MSLFYLVPVALISLWFGFRAGTIVAFAAAASWLWSDLLLAAYEPSISYWNAFTRLTTFVLVGWFVSEMRQDRIRLSSLNAQLQEAVNRESDLARRDQLTGLPNSRAFEEILSREIARSRRESIPIGIGYVDLDNFKKINDTFGHPEGDELLQRVAQALFLSIREEDYCARLGGDEFAMILVRPEIEVYDLVAARIFERVEEVAAMYEGVRFGATIGFVHFQTPPINTTAAVRAADHAMYRIKAREKGKHVVEIDPEP